MPLMAGLLGGGVQIARISLLPPPVCMKMGARRHAIGSARAVVLCSARRALSVGW